MDVTKEEVGLERQELRDQDVLELGRLGTSEKVEKLTQGKSHNRFLRIIVY